MNCFKKIYCRIYQGVFRLILPILPYRQPTLLSSNKEVSDVLEKKKIKTVMLVTDQGISKLGLAKNLENEVQKTGVKIVVFDKTIPNPTTDIIEEALEIYKKEKCEGLIAFGGGSPIDCAKAVGARIARPDKTLKQMKGVLKVKKQIPLLIAVPTTAGTGSETTLAAVVTDSETRHKYAINDFPLIPKYALLEPKLTVGLPKSVTSATGMDALTHAVEAYIGKSTTKQTRKYSLSATKKIFENLLTAYKDGGNLTARKNLLEAAYEAGVAFTKAYVGYSHAIAHTLGGKYDTPHGYANAVILPHLLKTYGKSVHKKLWKMGVYAGLFGKETSYSDGAEIFIKKIEDMNAKMDIPSVIKEIKKEDIPLLAKTADKEGNPLYPVPKLFDAKELEKIYYQITE